MSYIDASSINGMIYVSERDSHGKRRIRTFKQPWTFYYRDERGTFTSIFGDKLKRFRCDSRKIFESALQQKISEIGKESIFESEIKPLYRILEERYEGDEGPDLHVAFIDIESDKDPTLEYSKVDDPYAIINAITVYQKWHNKFFTIVVRPDNLSESEAEELLSNRSHQDKEGNVVPGPGDDGFGELSEEHGYFLVNSEEDLLLAFLDLIEDADVISDWNGQWYDLPMLVQRIRITLGGESLDKLRQEGQKFEPSESSQQFLKRLCLFPKLPEMRMVDHFGKLEKNFILNGRVHLDYLDLYQKFTFEELHSYSLDAILKKEADQNKIAYEGSLDQLYRWDLRRFTAYNRQDVAGLSKIDDKRKLISLANAMAHMAGVTLDKTLGSVAIIQQAILKKLHKNGLICFDKTERVADLPVPGAFVVDPVKGMYEWICSFDFNSLYPTTIRLINISPEMMVGQFDLSRTVEKWKEYYEKFKEDSAKAWGMFTGVLEYHMIIDETDDLLTFVVEGGDHEEITLSAKEWKKIIADSGWSLSANGTVFDLSKEGIVTQCMSSWYNDRVSLQKKAKAAKDKISSATTTEEKTLAENDFLYYDQTQLVLKIFLNSTYGAYLNEAFLFYDARLGASVTLSGRVMTKHMVRYVSQILTGNYDFDRKAIITGDTDSVIGSSIVETNNGPVSIEDLFNSKKISQQKNGVELGIPNLGETVLSYDHEHGPMQKPYRFIYRHKTRKQKWKITTKLGQSVEVTEDHSLMVVRNGKLLEVKPNEILRSDQILIKSSK